MDQNRFSGGQPQRPPQGAPQKMPQGRPQGMPSGRPPQGMPPRGPQQGMPPRGPQQGRPMGAPPRGPQQGRPMGTPPQGRPPQRPPQKQSRYGAVFMGILIGTVTLLVISLIVLCVVLAVGDNGKKPVENDGGGASKPMQEQTTDKPNKIPANTVRAKFLSLPSATLSGSYLPAMGGAVDVSSDARIQSAAAVVVDMSAGTVIAGKNAETRVYPASMTKVMTLLVACEIATDPTAKMTVTQQMVDYHRTSGGSGMMSFVAGESITVEDALFLVNYNSDTVACLLLAEHLAGSEAAFVEKMNAKAAALGLTGTHFVNTTGLHDENHYTTCREMAAIMACAMNNPAAQKVLTSFEGYTVSVYNGDAVKRSSTVYAGWFSDRLNDNKWAGGGSDMQFMAGKTGYEDIPTSCFVTVAKNTADGNKQYICVTVGRLDNNGEKINNATSTADAKYLYRRYAEGDQNA